MRGLSLLKNRRRSLGIAAFLLGVGLLLVRGLSIPPGPNAYVEVLEMLGENLPDHQYVCISPRRGYPSTEVPEAIRHALETAGWQFYDSELPADTSVYMLYLPTPHRRGPTWLLSVAYTTDFISRHSGRVSDFSNSRYFRLICLAGNCGPIFDKGTVHTDTFWGEDPATYYANGVGHCTGQVPSPEPSG